MQTVAHQTNMDVNVAATKTGNKSENRTPDVGILIRTENRNKVITKHESRVPRWHLLIVYIRF